jgi:predicted ATPase
MIKHVKIRNFRSFVDAEVDLQPFSLVVGANGSGKTNLLRLLELVHRSAGRKPADVRTPAGRMPSKEVFVSDKRWIKHSNHETLPGKVILINSSKKEFIALVNSSEVQAPPFSPSVHDIFSIVPDLVSGFERVSANALVSKNGTGTAQVLDMLKNGDKEELFDAIEAHFRRYVPEVEKLSLKTVSEGTKQIQVRERGLKKPLPATELSEGTRIILAILTIIHQEKPPTMILLEDIDRGLHPRLFEYLAPLLRDIAIRHDINIVATTHNPYLVDAMQDNKEAVIIVEKKDGASTLSTLASRLEGMDYDSVDPDDMPLGQLWFSGLVGGTPVRISSRPSK